VGKLGKHVLVTATTDADANHERGTGGGKLWFGAGKAKPSFSSNRPYESNPLELPVEVVPGEN
jgi:hypothetical protein